MLFRSEPRFIASCAVRVACLRLDMLGHVGERCVSPERERGRHVGWQPTERGAAPRVHIEISGASLGAGELAADFDEGVLFSVLFAPFFVSLCTRPACAATLRAPPGQRQGALDARAW